MTSISAVTTSINAAATAEPLIIVYIAVHRASGKRYIGVTTKGLKKRRSGHAAQAKSGNKSYFSRAVLKHGIDEFEFSILEACPDGKTALERERALISEWSPEYNTAAGGCSGPQGWKHSDETRKKLSESHIGKPGPWRGKKRSLESMAKMVATRAANGIKPMLGRRHSAETIAKIKATRPFLPPPRPLTPDEIAPRRARCLAHIESIKRPIRCANNGRVYTHAAAAAADPIYGVGTTAIAKWCHGRAVSKAGWIFEFIS